MQPEAIESSKKQDVRALFRDRQGSTYALLAAALLPMIGFAGIGLDLGRTYLASSRLQSGVDAAVLAAVRTEQLFPGTGSNPGPKTVETVNAYLYGNMPQTFMGATQATPVVSVKRVGEEITVDLTVEGTVRTSLMRVFGFENLPIRAQAVGVAGKTLPRAVEAMLVLDVTGSMDGNGGMTALKASVKDFLDVVYGKAETRKNFAIGMLPYNVIVNVGHLLPSSRVQSIDGFTTNPATDPYGWKGCLYADPTIRNLSTDINTIDEGAFDMGKNLPGDTGVPLANPFMYPPMWVDSFHYQDNRYKLGKDIDKAIAAANHEPMRTALVRTYGQNICRMPDGADTSCTVEGAKVHPERLPDYGSWPEPILYNSLVKPSNKDGYVPKSPNYVCPTQAMPVSYSWTRTQLQSYSDALQPLFNIGTWHNPAMTWGYRLLARDDVFTRVRPTDTGLRQVVVFMTDGNFDSRDDGLNTSVRTPNFQRDTAYSAYGSYADKRMIDKDYGSSNKERDAAREDHRTLTGQRFLKTCQAMKKEGIEIYTITFALKNPGIDATREMFRTCATNRNTHFFETKKASDLRAAFVTIGADLVDVHLEK